MDSEKLILTEPVSPLVSLAHLNDEALRTAMVKAGSDQTESISDLKKQQIARDFESLLLTKLLDEMKKTIGDWSFEKDEVSRQVRGIFWLYLARDIADKGGFGLWKDIYKALNKSVNENQSAESLDKKV